MKSGQITIKDIARELKISPSTVSRALKNHPDISPETKKAVTALASKLDYQPNSIALSLRKSKTNIIGVVIPEIVHYFFSTIISGIEDVAYGAGYNVMICQSNESYSREVTNIHALMSSRVDGLLASISSETTDHDHFQSINKRGIPLVFFDRVSQEIPASRVVVDDHDGAFRAVEHLYEQGCRNIAHLTGPNSLDISHSRKQGYLDALKSKGLPVKDEFIVEAGLTIEAGVKACKELLSREEKPDGLLAFSDPVAIGVMKVAREMGIAIPEDLALVGFSNEPITSIIHPSITTVAQPGYEMGRLATQLFLDESKAGDDFVPETKILKTNLLIRESSRRIR
ncbi:LacI family DNA-binding transcriptional regulator [Roseivirga sp. BDSF3-8]|uniref:LacI family DNA-binding transcriptional regulator n=1 Tax=Roseivirga sp. BDSF3-8 TaxID=3241598 RepID=UPI00353221DD